MPLRKILILVITFPFLNFIHEGGHWIGAKLVGKNPTMLLQRVDIDNQERDSFGKATVYNWGGPTINYAIIVGSYFCASMLPVAFAMSTHRLGSSIFANLLYTRGKSKFTNDETKQFNEKWRLSVSIIFTFIYLILTIQTLKHWLPNLKLWEYCALVLAFPALWIGYLTCLDILDKSLF